MTTNMRMNEQPNEAPIFLAIPNVYLVRNSLKMVLYSNVICVNVFHNKCDAYKTVCHVVMIMQKKRSEFEHIIHVSSACLSNTAGGKKATEK